MMNAEQRRIQQAIRLGLPEDTPESVIRAAEAKRYREALAQEHQLPATATWQDIANAINAEVKAALPDNFPNG